MKKASTLAVFVFIALHSFSQVNKGMPSVAEVATWFFSTYVPPDSQKVLLRFQKKAAGWFIAEYDYEASGIVKQPKLFWDKSSQEFIELDYAKADQADTAAMASRAEEYAYNNLDYYTQYQFARHVFYGYDGWDNDVISYAASITNPTDTLQESLGRAYDNRAVNYFYSQYGFSSNNRDTGLVTFKDNQPVPAIRVKLFAADELNAINAYKRLKALNPAYETIVGNVDIKLNHEKMFAYTTLKFIGYEKEGLPFINDVHYTDSLTDDAVKIFAEIKPNGLVFTMGDNITYAMWYLQQKGVRPDVTVINNDLNGLKRVVYYLDKKYKHSLFNIDSSIYMRDDFTYAIYKEGSESDKPIRVDSFLQQLYNSPKTNPLEKGNNTAFSFAKKNLYIRTNKAFAEKLYNTNKLQDSVYTPIGQAYLTINSIIQFDILQKNFCRRHIYFTFKTDDPEYLKSEIQHGPVWEFTPEVH